ncbi:MAG: lycopene cyclase domain-containing protein [Nocardioidaceae bacterium]
MTYSTMAVIAVVVSGVLDLVVLRTRLLLARGFWLSYAIILGFQLIVNGTLTGAKIVTYDPETILGLRIVHAPVEDIGFGFAMTCVTLMAWTLLGTRSRPVHPGTGSADATDDEDEEQTS